MTGTRLFAATGPGLVDHLAAYGELRSIGTGFVDDLGRSGLTGRGGAGFPAVRKARMVSGRAPVVVGNGAEGEPLSRKDLELLTRAPHLVLDGLHTAVDAVGAEEVYLYIRADAAPAVRAALGERGADRHRVQVVEAPAGFVSGEESAAIRRIEGGPALPRDRTVVAAVRGVRGRPTLVHNVETLAHIALIARFGADWFGAVGDPDTPGTMLVTLSGALTEPGVVEVPTGTALSELVPDPDVQAVLVGGYHGTWVAVHELADARVSRSGIVHALGAAECGLARAAEIAGYLAAQSARQCGPCRNGLPTLAGLFDTVAHGRAEDAALREIRRILRLVDGRGSCRHPDGTARMLRSAAHVFAADIDRHRRGGCVAAR